MSASDNETVAEITGRMRRIKLCIPRGKVKVDDFDCIVEVSLSDFADRLDAANGREVAELKHWIKSAARWIDCHDIYHTSGGYLLKQAKEILKDDGEFLFKEGEQ